MAKHDSRHQRLDAIERRLALRPEGWTTGELAADLGVNTSTVFRDLNELESRGTGCIKQGRRYMLDHRRSMHTIRMTNDEVMALYLAARLLSRYSDEHNPHVVVALEKLADALQPKTPLMARHIFQAAIAVRSRRIRSEYVQSLEVMTQGWAESRRIHFRYRSANNETTDRAFDPYFIEPSGIGYACHVIGYDHLRETLRTFKIERMYEARLTDERFVVPPEFDPQRLLASAWGVIWRDEGAITVTLRFAPTVVQRVKESVWHHSQDLKDLPDGSCLFTVLVGSTLEMKPWIRQWGAAVQVLEPAELRQELMDEVRAMANAYGLHMHEELP